MQANNEANTIVLVDVQNVGYSMKRYKIADHKSFYYEVARIVANQAGIEDFNPHIYIFGPISAKPTIDPSSVNIEEIRSRSRYYREFGPHISEWSDGFIPDMIQFELLRRENYLPYYEQYLENNSANPNAEKMSELKFANSFADLTHAAYSTATFLRKNLIPEGANVKATDDYFIVDDIFHVYRHSHLYVHGTQLRLESKLDDTSLVKEAIRSSSKYENAILLGGDGDYTGILNDYHRKFGVIFPREASYEFVGFSRTLRESLDHVHFMGMNEIAYMETGYNINNAPNNPERWDTIRRKPEIR